MEKAFEAILRLLTTQSLTTKNATFLESRRDYGLLATLRIHNTALAHTRRLLSGFKKLALRGRFKFHACAETEKVHSFKMFIVR